MGSFNATCIISNLPIEAGTPVRSFLITGNRFHRDGNDHICYVSGRWQLRGPAIRAQYNDYGTIEKWEKNLAFRATYEALSRDCFEKGVGDNQCHDVQVRRNMKPEQWLEALWEGRVFVGDQPFRPSPMPKDYKDPEPKEGIPSLTRLEKVLADAGEKTVTSYGAEGYFVDQLSYGFIRVRYGRDSGESDLKPLEKAVGLCQKAGYAAMITCGTGNYKNHGEVLVAPRPPSKGEHFFADGVSDEPDELRHPTPRPVCHVMVRDDVWRILLETKCESFRGDFTFEKMAHDALEAMKQVQELKKEEKSWEAKEKSGQTKAEVSQVMRDLFRLQMDLGQDFENKFWAGVHSSEGVSGFSLKQAFTLGFELAKNDKELVEYVMDAAEMTYVQIIYAQLHGQWHPTTNSGQDGNWTAHRNFMRKLIKIRGRWEDEK